MILNIIWSERLKCPHSNWLSFIQGMANRLLQGHARYGLPKKESGYLAKLTLELKSYKKSGNAEHLFNIANYCQLEFQCPQNPKFHFDPYAKSATRKP